MSTCTIKSYNMTHVQGQDSMELKCQGISVSAYKVRKDSVNMPFQEIMPSNRGQFQWNNQLEMHDLSLLREHACRKQSNPQSKRILEPVTSLCNITLPDRSRFNICYRVGFRKITKNRRKNRTTTLYDSLYNIYRPVFLSHNL